MPFPNPYVIPGVYVTQSGTSLNNINTTPLNVAIVADQITLASRVDTFNNVVSSSGITIGQLTAPMVNTTYSGTYASASGFTVQWTTSSGTTKTGVSGINFNIYTASGQPYTIITTSGVASSGVDVYPSGTVTVQYGHNWGAYGTYSNLNQVVNTIGPAISGTSTIANPAVLAAQFAFQNGANVVQIMPVARISGVTSASDSDWGRVFTLGSGSSDQTYLSNLVGADVIVPLYGFVNSNGQPTLSIVSSGINTFLTGQAKNAVYQRAFIGVDGTSNQVTASGMQLLAASGFNSTRVSLVYPPVVNYNPGLNTNTGLTNVNFNIPGYYVAAAMAALFVGQPNVATPITNKTLTGFNAIPNQISLNDAQTNYLPYGISTVYQKRDGNFWVLQGLTTNMTNWLTQEISINAIGDQLSNNIYRDLSNSYLVGGPLTQITLAGVVGTVQNTLINAVSTGLIQSYQNVVYSVNPATPTTVNVSFQYSPTYPINYIQVTLSLNTQTGTVINANTQTNLVTY